MRIYICSVLALIVACNQNSQPVIVDELIEDSIGFEFQNQEFEKFYTKFISDSIFQISSISNPLSGNYTTYDESKEWNLSNWPVINWDFRNEIISSDDSVSIIQSDTSFFYGTYCIDCGFSFEMLFEKMNGGWKMTRRQENNF